nr:UDP-GlcNAc:betaGal beta-1,3-N-acetylglucosaminyltransferase 8 isoform X2 [Camelus dromedarius]
MAPPALSLSLPRALSGAPGSPLPGLLAPRQSLQPPRHLSRCLTRKPALTRQSPISQVGLLPSCPPPRSLSPPPSAPPQPLPAPGALPASSSPPRPADQLGWRTRAVAPGRGQGRRQGGPDQRPRALELAGAGPGAPTAAPSLGRVMRCPKCLLCLSALLTLLGLKVYIEWTSEPRLSKAYPGPRSTPPGPTPACPEPTLPANLSARLGQTGPLPMAYWNQQQWRLGTLPSGDSTEAGDCNAWGAAAAAEIPDFTSYPEDLRHFLLSAACRSFPRWLPGGGGGQVASCKDSDVPYLLLAVKSEPGRFAERQAVRETWGGPAPGVRLLFLLGSPEGKRGPDLGSLAAWESRRYSDLLLWDFLDVPFNQTLKDLLLLAWLGHHCPSVRFVLRTQDDAFVHIPALLDHLRALPPSRARVLYLGEVFTQAKPLRKPGGPFYVPGSFFEGSYPAYASGGGYVIAGRLAPWLLQAAARVAPFPFDDVYTGLCFQALGLVPRTHKGFLTAWPADRTADPCAFRDLLLVRPLSPQDSIRLWKQLQDPQLQC